MNDTTPPPKHARDMTDAEFKAATAKIIADGHAARIRADSARAFASIELAFKNKPGAA